VIYRSLTEANNLLRKEKSMSKKNYSGSAPQTEHKPVKSYPVRNKKYSGSAPQTKHKPTGSYDKPKKTTSGGALAEPGL